MELDNTVEEKSAEAQSDDDDPPEDYVKVLNSTDNEQEFELICKELSNKNARSILKEIAYGVDTSPAITEKTHLSLQDVLLHLNKLEATGLIDRTNSKLPSFRGRKPVRYEVSHIAVLLIPEEEAIIANKSQIITNIKKKALSRLKKRIALSGASTSMLDWLLFRYILNYLVSLRPSNIGGGSTATPIGLNPFTMPKASSIALDATLLIVILASPFVFMLMHRVAKILIH